MRIVIDANRIIAALIKESTTRNILFNDKFIFITPDHSFSEIEKHKKDLMNKSKTTEKEFQLILSLIFENITVIPEKEYSHLLKQSEAQVIDKEDSPYLAVCLAMKAEGIWTHDQHLKEQNLARIFTNIDFLNLKK
jgi:predicted nucleic acid-binding protein